MKFSTFAASALLALGAAASADAASTVETLLGIISGNITKPYNVSTLVGLATQYPEVVGLASQNTTLFAPTDAAFASALVAVPAALQGANITSVNLSDPAVIGGILKFHLYRPFAGGQTLINSYLNSSDPSKLTTLNPQRSLVNYANGTAITNGLYQPAQVIDTIPTDNGVINVVNNLVLPPLCPTDTAKLGGPEFAGFLGAVTQQNLTNVVNTLPQATIFAPNTTAFQTALAALGTLNVTLTPELINGILAYHVVPAVAFSSELPAGNSTVPTLANETLPISNTAAGVVVGTAPYTAKVTLPNVGTCNGVVSLTIDSVWKAAHSQH
ncbi:hypothetical protein DFJ74DRAFT_667798 [Hyaloraphidium curvatum]|nr:hypothetical protein DFJ74DRAFT_667798 [Hyaloraphidium curvatum]